MTSQSHPIVSARPIRIATTNRQRLLRTRLRGRFQVMAEKTTVPGPVIIVSGQKISDASGTVTAMESNSMREGSRYTALPLPLPAATQAGHQTWPPNSTEHSWHTKRPHWWQAATARLEG